MINKDNLMAKSNTTRKPLTAVNVRGLKFDAKDPNKNILSDIHPNSGLRIVVNKSGSKSWIYRYRIDGRLRKMKLGDYATMSLKEARAELAEKKKLRTVENKDPLEEKRKIEAQRKEESDRKLKQRYTINDLCNDFLEGCIDGNRTVKAASECRRSLINDPMAVLGHLPAVEVNSKMVYKMISAIVERGAKVQAGFILKELTNAFSYAIGKDLFDDYYVNPCLQVKENFKLQKVKLTNNKATRVLNDGELSTLLKWLPTSPFTTGQKGVLTISLLTGCRTGEACLIKWTDLDIEKGEWHLSKTKTGVARIVQLSNQARTFLAGLDKNNSEYVFLQRGNKPVDQKKLSENMWWMRKKGTDLKIAHWSPHDLRRTVRTGLARMRCPSEIAEAVLGHTKGGVVGVYNLHSYESECKEWLQKWSDHLDTLKETKNLVSLGVANG